MVVAAENDAGTCTPENHRSAVGVLLLYPFNFQDNAAKDCVAGRLRIVFIDVDDLYFYFLPNKSMRFFQYK